MIFVYIGMVVVAGFDNIVVIVHLVVFLVLVIVVIVRLVMEYHKNSLSEEIYQGPLYIYSMLINAAALGIPMVGASSMLLIVYLAPLGMLALISILNKEMRILEKSTIRFFIVEIVMSGLCVAVVEVNDSIRTYVLVIVLSLCLVMIVVEMGLTYYGGI